MDNVAGQRLVNSKGILNELEKFTIGKKNPREMQSWITAERAQFCLLRRVKLPLIRQRMKVKLALRNL